MRKNILIVKETKAQEKRVGLVPADVPELIRLGYQVFIEDGAGIHAGFSNEEYEKQGASIRSLEGNAVPSYQNLFKDIHLILRAKRPEHSRERAELQAIERGTLMVGAFDLFEDSGKHILAYERAGIISHSIDQLKGLSSDDPMNILASMSAIAGKVAFKEAIQLLNKKNVEKTVIIGGGTAGISASLAATEQSTEVFLLTRREVEQVDVKDNPKIKKILFPKESTLEIQQSFIAEQIRDAQVIITCARAPQEVAPILIPKATLEILNGPKVIVDLALSEGGNVFGSKHDETIETPRGILISNESGYPKRFPREASILWSKANVAFVKRYLMK